VHYDEHNGSDVCRTVSSASLKLAMQQRASTLTNLTGLTFYRTMSPTSLQLAIQTCVYTLTNITGLAFYHTRSSCVIVHHSDVRLHNDQHNRSGFLSHKELLGYSSPFKDVRLHNDEPNRSGFLSHAEFVCYCSP